jgi:hypothetical protein
MVGLFSESVFHCSDIPACHSLYDLRMLPTNCVFGGCCPIGVMACFTFRSQ